MLSPPTAQLLSQLCVYATWAVVIVIATCVVLAWTEKGLMANIQAELHSIKSAMAINRRGTEDMTQRYSELSEQVEKNRAAQELLKRLSGVISELRTQLGVSAEGHELVRSHSDSIERLQLQLQIKTNAQHELERQACTVAEMKSQVRSSERGWRMELSHQGGRLDALRSHVVSAMQLLQQLQSQAAKLDSAQAAIAQELKAQKQERGETLRRATLELALAELTHGRRDHTVKQSNADSPAHSLISKTFRRRARRHSRASSISFVSEWLQTSTVSQTSRGATESLCPGMPTGSDVFSESITVGGQPQEPQACVGTSGIEHTPRGCLQEGQQPGGVLEGQQPKGGLPKGQQPRHDVLEGLGEQPPVVLKPYHAKGDFYNSLVEVGDHSDKSKFKLTGIAHAHTGMPAGDNDRDTKAPLLRPWSGFLHTAKKKRQLLEGQQTANRQTLRSFVSESILDANRLSPLEQPVNRTGSIGMHSLPPGMSQGIAVSMGKHFVMNEANAAEPRSHVSEDVARGVGLCSRRAPTTVASLDVETA